MEVFETKEVLRRQAKKEPWNQEKAAGSQKTTNESKGKVMAGVIITKILDDGTKSYQVRMRLNGKQKAKTFKRRVDADAYLSRNSSAVHDGVYRPLKKARFEDFIVNHWKPTYLTPE